MTQPGHMTFRSRLSLDGTYRTVTLLVSGVVAVSLVGAVRAGAAVGIAALALVVGVLAIAWAMAPREVVVEHDELRIERRAWRSQRIPLSEVEGAERLSTIGRAVRVFGVGGFFGSYGLFSSKAIGRFLLFATRRGQAVIVRRTNGALPIVITPDDMEGTIDAIGVLAGGAELSVPRRERRASPFGRT
ncbi:MAG TPA: PH domain-containing protein [Polyangiaceae bacterium]|nr:PH domain-containing protein [Polyangiaceae bacterium]